MNRVTIFLNYGLAYSFRGLVHYHHGREQGSRNGSHGAATLAEIAESYILIHRQQGEKETKTERSKQGDTGRGKQKE